MTTAKATIEAGVCGFVTEVTATCEDGQHVSFSITTPCEKIGRLSETLPTVDAFAEIGSGFEGRVFTAVRSCCEGCCSGCAVPVGVFKAMQVAAGLALPRPVTIQLSKV
jgi:hypothetical protein